MTSRGIEKVVAALLASSFLICVVIYSLIGRVDDLESQNTDLRMLIGEQNDLLSDQVDSTSEVFDRIVVITNNYEKILENLEEVNAER